MGRREVLRGEGERARKERYGQFFTPMSIADRMVAVVMGRLRERGQDSEEELLKLRVFDPAVGGGNLLVSWCHAVADRIYLLRYGSGAAHPRFTTAYRLVMREVVCNCYGMDIDESCIARSREALSMLSGLPVSEFEGRIVCGDYLFTDTNAYDVLIMNPPYLGGLRISGVLGSAYREALEWKLARYHGLADLSAYFIQRACGSVTSRGLISLVATTTIAEGRTRSVGLGYVLDVGFRIYAAERNVPWSGDANVRVHIAHFERGGSARGSLASTGDSYNSQLERGEGYPVPRKLAENVGCSFGGCIPWGSGFVLTKDERDYYVDRDPRNAEVIYPFITGRDLNTSPLQKASRYVIDFGERSLEEASHWPELVDRLRTQVKPYRESPTSSPSAARSKEHWWRFYLPIPKVGQSLPRGSRILLISRLTTHLAFAFKPMSELPSKSMGCICLDTFAHFGLLQSRVHEVWARLLSSTQVGCLRYSISDCFETFPFPAAEFLDGASELERIGRELYEYRAEFLIAHDLGFTKAYNLLKSPLWSSPEGDTLRGLHESLDRAVLSAYGWGDIEVPPFVLPDTEGYKRAYEVFRSEVLRRLFALNAQRGDS